MSDLSKHKRDSRLRRHRRIRKKVTGTAARPRLAVFRSSKHMHAQLIDDVGGRTLASASTLDASLRSGASGTSGGCEAAAAVGRLLAERAGAAGVSEVVFDRGGFLYHGRVAALAEAARSAGLEF